MKLLKSYMAFSPRRIFYLRILLPAGILLLFIPCMPFLKIALYPSLYPCLFFVDALLDFWLLNGIYEKGSANIEYIKTSTRGIKLIQNVTICDMLFRLYPMVVIPFIAAGIELLQNRTSLQALKDYPLNLLLAMGAAYAITTLNVMVIRFISNFSVYFCVISVTAALSDTLFAWLLIQGRWWMIIPALICAAGFCILSYWLITTRVKSGYYDTAPSLGNSSAENELHIM